MFLLAAGSASPVAQWRISLSDELYYECKKRPVSHSCAPRTQDLSIRRCPDSMACKILSVVHRMDVCRAAVCFKMRCCTLRNLKVLLRNKWLTIYYRCCTKNFCQATRHLRSTTHAHPTSLQEPHTKSMLVFDKPYCKGCMAIWLKQPGFNRQCAGTARLAEPGVSLVTVAYLLLLYIVRDLSLTQPAETSIVQ